MRMMLCLFLLVFGSTCVTAQAIQNPMVISGYVRDFEGRAIDSANVLLQDRSFNPVAQAVTDTTGHYTIKAEKKDYYALVAIRMSDYVKSRLEYWAWKIPPADTLSINPRYHRLEVYGMNAFTVQGSGSRSVFVYFRPMKSHVSGTMAIPSRHRGCPDACNVSLIDCEGHWCHHRWPRIKYSRPF